MDGPRQNPADLRTGWNSHILEPDPDDDEEDGDPVMADAPEAGRRPQAKAIPEQAVLDAISQALAAKIAAKIADPPRWVTALHLTPGTYTTVSRWEIGALLPVWPEKVLLAKLRSMLRRGLIDGCACGCSGGFEVKGSAALAQNTSAQQNLKPTNAG